MLTTINGDNGTYLNIDMWYDDEFVPGKFGASVVFSDLDAEYRGNIYSENGEMIGDFTSDDSVLVEQNFNIGWVDDDDIDHWNGVNASTDIEASDSGVCQYVRDELARVEKTLSTTTTDPDSYNMGWLDGRRTALRDVLTHCPQDINSATEPKYTADMCSIGASEDDELIHVNTIDSYGQPYMFGDTIDIGYYGGFKNSEHILAQATVTDVSDPTGLITIRVPLSQGGYREMFGYASDLAQLEENYLKWTPEE